ncbi:MAG: hydrogenase maturation protease [Vicinamibacterales bacterium]
MTLVIGIGNALRGDDGIGPEIARRIALARDDVKVLTPRQLLPEHAYDVGLADLVIVVDAAVGPTPGTVTCERVRPGVAARLDHAISPAALVTLVRDAFGWQPSVWTITVQGACFDIGAPISAAVADAVPDAVHAALALMPQPIGCTR